MGYFSELEIAIQEMAHDMGDDFGSDPVVIQQVAQIFNVTQQQVKTALNESAVFQAGSPHLDFVDVAGMTAQDVQYMGHADD